MTRNIELEVTAHIKSYRGGIRSCPRTENRLYGQCGSNSDAYIAEWDRQMLALRSKMFKRGVK